MPTATRVFVRRLKAAPFPDGKHGKVAAYNDSSVLFVVPGHFDPARPFDIVVYLHGWYTDIANQYGIGTGKTIWYGLDNQVDKVSRNVLLLAPQLPKNIGSGDPGKLQDKGGAKALLAEARDVLASEFKDHSAFANAFDAAPLIVVSYSGGYRAAACFVRLASGVPDRVKAVLMLDSLYGRYADFAAWIGARRTNTAFVSLAIKSKAKENTLTPSIALLEKLGGSKNDVRPLPVQPPRLGEVHVYWTNADHRLVPVEGPPEMPLTWFLDALPTALAAPLALESNMALSTTRPRISATLSPFRRKLVAIVEAERAFFAGHKEWEDGSESKPPGSNYAARVGEYWNAVGKKYNGKNKVPWSAAFISWAMKGAGAGAAFPYHQRHGHYIKEAIKNRLDGNLSAPIVGYRTADWAPRVGDLIGQGRDKSAGMTYDLAAKTSSYESHVDVVVELGDGVLYAVGGNVSNTVSRKKLALDDKGRLRRPASGGWFVVIAVNV